MGILFLTALNKKVMKDFKKMKRELTEEKEKKTSFSTDYKKRLTVSCISIPRIVQIKLTVDMTIVDTEINTITTTIRNPMNKSSPRTTILVRMKLMRDNIMNVIIKIFKVLIPPNRTPINFRHQVVIIIINNPACPTLSTG